MSAATAQDDLAALADAVAEAALGCPAVARLSGGAFGAVATYLPGRTVAGVRVRDHSVAIGVVAAWEGLSSPTPQIAAAQVREAVTPLVGRRSLSVTVEDVDLPSEPADGEDEPGAPGVDA